MNSSVMWENTPMYSARPSPAPTDGLEVLWLTHEGQVGHGSGRPADCNGCGQNIVNQMKGHVGISDPDGLSWRDVLILCDNPSDNSALVQTLRQNNVPVTVLAPDGQTQTEALRNAVLSKHDHVIVADHSTVSGLERRLVIGMGGYVTKRPVMSRLVKDTVYTILYLSLVSFLLAGKETHESDLHPKMGIFLGLGLILTAAGMIYLDLREEVVFVHNEYSLPLVTIPLLFAIACVPFEMVEEAVVVDWFRIILACLTVVSPLGCVCPAYFVFTMAGILLGSVFGNFENSVAISVGGFIGTLLAAWLHWGIKASLGWYPMLFAKRGMQQSVTMTVCYSAIVFFFRRQYELVHAVKGRDNVFPLLHAIPVMNAFASLFGTVASSAWNTRKSVVAFLSVFAFFCLGLMVVFSFALSMYELFLTFSILILSTGYSWLVALLRNREAMTRSHAVSRCTGRLIWIEDRLSIWYYATVVAMPLISLLCLLLFWPH